MDFANAKVGIDFNRKSQSLALISRTPAGQQLGQPSIVHFGDLLNALDLTAEDCAGALQDSKAREVVVPRISEHDAKQVAALPPDFTGRTILDLGGYDGYVAHACLERGAKRAVVVDNCQYQGYTLAGFPFGWASPRAYSGVEYVTGDIMDTVRWAEYAGLGDVVICFNVIYHVRDPLGTLLQLRLLTQGELYLSTSVLDLPGSTWHFNPDAAKCIYFTPTKQGLEDALAFAGFKAELIAEYDPPEVIYRCV